MKTIEIPQFRFMIGEKIVIDNNIYTIYNIVYDMKENCWMYKYSYWDGGYEHYCKSPITYIESRFEVTE